MPRLSSLHDAEIPALKSTRTLIGPITAFLCMAGIAQAQTLSAREKHWIDPVTHAPTAATPAQVTAYDPIFASGFEKIPVYYVAPNGNDNGPGTKAQPWQHINHAVGAGSPAPAGSIIYVAPGTYNEHVVVEKNGLSIIGYKTTPGDQPPILANAPIDVDAPNPFPAFNPADMPLLDGQNRATGYGFELFETRNITIRNFNIKRYGMGLYAGSNNRSFRENLRLDNVNVQTIGDLSEGYSGTALALGSMSTRFSHGAYITNSLIINAAAEGLNLSGDDNVAENVRVYGMDGNGTASTDYYIIITGSRNVIRNSLIWRNPGSDHSGHGITIKDNVDQQAGAGIISCEDNLIENNTVYNMAEGLVVRHSHVQLNTFLGNTAHGNNELTGGCGDGNGIYIRDGANRNTYTNTTIENTCHAITFGDSVEDGGPNGTPPNDNVIDNAQVNNSDYGVWFWRGSSEPNSDAGSNLIRNSRFLLTRHMFVVGRPAANMRYENTRFSGTEGVSSGSFRSGPYEEDVVRSQFNNCIFELIDGGLPPGW